MLWMAKSKTYGCDTDSSRCTQLLIDRTLAVEHNRMTVYSWRIQEGFAQGEQSVGEELRVFRIEKRAHEGVRRYYRWDCLHHQRWSTSIATMECWS